jgi:hypothetical protein
VTIQTNEDSKPILHALFKLEELFGKVSVDVNKVRFKKTYANPRQKDFVESKIYEFLLCCWDYSSKVRLEDINDPNFIDLEHLEDPVTKILLVLRGVLRKRMEGQETVDSSKRSFDQMSDDKEDEEENARRRPYF